MTRPLIPAMPAVLLLAAALAAPVRAAEDPCVAANNRVRRGGKDAAREAFLLARPSETDTFGNRYEWSRAGGCKRVISTSAGQMKGDCHTEEHFGEALAALCQGRQGRAAATERETRQSAERLASRLQHQALDADVVREFRDFRAANPPAELRRMVDDAYEKGLIKRMGEQRYRNGGQEPAPTQLDRDAYAAWLQARNTGDAAALKTAQNALEARAREYEGTLRMQAQARQRQAADYAAAEAATQARQRQEQAEAAANRKAAQCAEFRQMQQESGCRPGSLNSVCMYAAQQLKASGC